MNNCKKCEEECIGKSATITKDSDRDSYLQSLELENKQLLEKVAALEKALNRACEYQIGHLCSDPERMSRNCKQSNNIELRDPCLDCWIDYFMGVK